MDCKAFCDLNSKHFRELCDKFSISNTHFIRTSDEEHKNVVHKIWNELDRRGFILKANYDGWYSINDETFIPNNQVKTIDEYRNKLNSLMGQQCTQLGQQTDQPDDDEVKNPEELLNFLDQQLSKNTTKQLGELRVDSKSGNLLEHSQEFNYIFKLENVRDRLIRLIKDDEKFISPNRFRNILLNMIESDNLNNVSISRAKTRFNWGISVPNDDDQIVSVCLAQMIYRSEYFLSIERKIHHFFSHL